MKLYYTTTAGQNSPQYKKSASLGGYKSSIVAPNDSFNNLFGDITTKSRSFARKHKDLINPIIGRVRTGAKSGINHLASKTNEKVDE